MALACAAEPVRRNNNTGGTGGDDETGGTSGSSGSSGSGGRGGSGTGGSGGSGEGGSGGSSGSSGSGGCPDAGGQADGPVSGTGGSRGSQSKTIKLDTTAAGANVMGDVANYPVAIVLNAMNFDFSQAKAKGEDIRFSGADGAALPYAIESWDPAAKLAALWVKVNVKGGAVTMIKMSWADPAASDASDTK